MSHPGALTPGRAGRGGGGGGGGSESIQNHIENLQSCQGDKVVHISDTRRSNNGV